MKRLGALALLLCSGCASVLPNTAAAIAPADFEDVLLGIAADAEQWVILLMMFAGV